jgi:chromosome segregation ATPase
VHQTLISHEKSSSIIERKYTIAKEMLDKATSERQKLAKTNFDLKRRADQLEAKLNANKIKEQIMAKKGIKSFSIKPDILSDTRIMTPETQVSHSWQSILYSGSEDQNNRDPAPSAITNLTEKSTIEKPTITDVPDFEALRLKIESLGKERDFVQNENRLLKVRVEELTRKIVNLEKRLSESNTKSEKLKQTLDNKSEELDNASKKYERAEKIAAHLEKQYKVAYN